MPKLDDTHIVRRLEKRIAVLEAGGEIAAKDFRAVLNDFQFAVYEKAWKAQQDLRKSKRAKNKEEEKKLGWKSKRELRLEILKQALKEAEANELEVLEKKFKAIEVRQATIYFEALKKAEAAGKEKNAMRSFANNELTRAGLPRIDGQSSRFQSERDREIFEQERYLIAQIRSGMSDDELQQIALAEGTDLVQLKKNIKQILDAEIRK
jgi:hypothetical protein